MVTDLKTEFGNFVQVKMYIFRDNSCNVYLGLVTCIELHNIIDIYISIYSMVLINPTQAGNHSLYIQLIHLQCSAIYIIVQVIHCKIARGKECGHIYMYWL